MFDWAQEIETAQANRRARERALELEWARKNLDKRVLTFLLPVSAFGLDGDTQAEIFVEYMQDRNHPVDPNKFVINLWVMETGNRLKMGVTTLFTPTIENEGPIEQAVRILSVVRDSEKIQEELTKAIILLRKNDPDLQNCPE